MGGRRRGKGGVDIHLNKLSKCKGVVFGEDCIS